MNAKISAIFVTFVGVWLLTIHGAVAQGLPVEMGQPTAPPPAEAVNGQETVDLTTCVESGLLIAQTEVQRLWEVNTWSNWATLLISLALAILAGWIVTAVLSWLGRRLQARGWRTRRYLFVSLIGPSKLILLTLGLQFGLAGLNLRMTPPLALEAFLSKLILLLYSIAVIWYASNLTQLIEVVLRRLAGRTESPLDQQLAPFAAKTLQWVLLVFGALYVAKTVFGQDIGAWLAGLGIAGLAVSLAAQDSLKNLFGSITILLDRPFRVGQRIVYAGYDGTVEEIGFRSTRLRTLTGNLVNIPNSKIVNDPIENIGVRPAIQRVINVTITYDTPREKIQQAVNLLRGILEEPGIGEPIHPVINDTPTPPRVFFNDFNADSLNIFVIYWYAPPSWWDYMAHAEKLNFRIFEEFEKAGIEFAFPTRTLYLADDPKRRLRIETGSSGA
jgi:MscS family membrane protein